MKTTQLSRMFIGIGLVFLFTLSEATDSQTTKSHTGGHKSMENQFLINGKKVTEQQFKELEKTLKVNQDFFQEAMAKSTPDGPVDTVMQSRQAIDPKTKKKYGLSYQTGPKGTNQSIQELSANE